MVKRKFWLGFFLTALAGLIGPSGAGASSPIFGDKPLHLIVGMPPGGGVDAYARLVQKHLSKYLQGTPAVVVENMPGAGSLRSVLALANSWQDDTTSIATFSSSLITGAIAEPTRIPTDFRQFAFLGNVAEDSRVCFVRSSMGIHTMQELMSHDSVNFGATAPGTSGNLDLAMLVKLFHVKLTQVLGYPGSAEKRLALDRGEIDGDCAGVTSLPSDWMSAKKINILVKFSPSEVAGLDSSVPFGGDLLPDETSRKVYDFLIAPQELGRLFMVSKKIPAERIAALRTAFDATMKDADFIAEAKAMGFLVTPTSGEAVDRRITDLYAISPEVLVKARLVTGE